MSGILKALVTIFVIVTILVIGARVFDEPSWGGFVFYLLFMFGLIGAAGYWLINLK